MPDPTMNPYEYALALQRLQQEQADQGLQSELSAYDELGPEAFGRMMGLGTMDERSGLARQSTQDQSGMLERKMALAQKLGTPKGKNYGTAAGNIAGGLGDALGAFAGGMQMRSLDKEQADLFAGANSQQAGMLDQQDATRGDFAKARMEALRKRLMTQPTQGPALAATAPAAPKRPMGPRASPAGLGANGPAMTPEPSDASLLSPLTPAGPMAGPAFDGGMSAAPPTKDIGEILAPYGGAPSFPNTPGGVDRSPALMNPQMSEAQRASLNSFMQPKVNRPASTPQDRDAAARAIALARSGAVDPYTLFGG